MLIVSLYASEICMNNTGAALMVIPLYPLVFIYLMVDFAT